jgi:anti-sigma regulatory factor (Ser/Thr protein kinase)
MCRGSLTCAFALHAAPRAVRLGRAHLRSWLEEANWPADQLDDIEYAASEAISNAVEHAYRAEDDGDVEVVSAIEALPGGARRVRVRVRDHGRWRAAPAEPQNRGRGMLLMDALTDELSIRRGDRPDVTGTEVVLLSPPVPATS